MSFFVLSVSNFPLLTELEDEPRKTFVSEDNIAEFDLSSTGNMVLPTYPLK